MLGLDLEMDTFTSSSSLTTTYIPGASDILNGTVTLTLTASGNSSLFGSSSDDLILNIVKAPIVDAGPDSLACEGPINIVGASIQNAGPYYGRLIQEQETDFLLIPRFKIQFMFLLRPI